MEKASNEALSTLYMLKVWDTVEFYPILTLDEAFGHTRLSYRNYDLDETKYFLNEIRKYFNVLKCIPTLMKLK